MACRRERERERERSKLETPSIQRIGEGIVSYPSYTLLYITPHSVLTCTHLQLSMLSTSIYNKPLKRYTKHRLFRLFFQQKNPRLLHMKVFSTKN